MDKEIVKWLKKNTLLFPDIAKSYGVTVPTLYSIANKDRKSRQKRIEDAVQKAYDERDQS